MPGEGQSWRQTRHLGLRSSAYVSIKLIVEFSFCCFHEEEEKADIRLGLGAILGLRIFAIMHAFIYASLVFILSSPRAIAKPIAIADDFSTDYSLFTGDDSELMETGDESDLFGPSDNFSDLSAAGSACSSDVSLLNNSDPSLGLDPSNDLLVRDLDDTLLAGKKPATCVNPDRASNSNQKLQLPQFEMLSPIDGSTSDGRCNTYGQSVLACCDYSANTSPLNCLACTYGPVHRSPHYSAPLKITPNPIVGPFFDCGKRWEYCCREILAVSRCKWKVFHPLYLRALTFSWRPGRNGKQLRDTRGTS